jgi:hypothetical protein
VDNIADALLINTFRGFNRVRVKGPMVVDDGQEWDVEDLIFFGEHPRVAAVQLDAAALTHNCIFRQLTVVGTLDGNNILEDCMVGNLLHVEGECYRSELLGTLTLGGTSGVHLRDCYSGALSTAFTAEVDMGGSGRNLAVHRFSGHLKISNLTGANVAVVSMNAGGVLIVGSTCTAGKVIASGVGIKVIDQRPPGSTCQVLTHYNVTAENIESKLAELHGGGSWEGGMTSEDLADILTPARLAILDSLADAGADARQARQALFNRLELQDGSTNNWVLYADDKLTPMQRWHVTAPGGSAIIVPDGSPARRTPA